MTPAANPERYKHHRFPPDIISHAVWLYFRFTLSHRDVEEMLFARGIGVTYEAIRKWCRKFGKLTKPPPEIRLAQRPGQVDPANRRSEHRTRWFDCQHCPFSNSFTAGSSRPPPQRQRITQVA